MKVTCIGIGSNTGYFMESSAKSLREKGYSIELACANSRDLDGDRMLNERIIKSAVSSDVVFLLIHGDVTYYKRFDELYDALKVSPASLMAYCNSDQEVTARYREMFKGSDEDYSSLLTYFAAGGDENYRSILLWTLKTFDHEDVEIPAPVMPPAQGVYLPGGKYISIEEGIERLDSSKPRVCIFMHQSFWLNKNAAAADMLIESLENKGASVITIFTFTHPNSRNNALGIGKIIDTYLIKNNESAVDCVVQTMGFAQTMNPHPGEYIQECSDSFFERLNVPVLQAIALYGSKEKWDKNPLGLNSSEIAGAVASPEFDGQLITVPFASYETNDVGERKYQGIKDRCDMIADTVLLWSELRRKRNEDKKTAILLYMYPPRADLAGSASSLDTLESTARLLQRMVSEGYILEWIPENGKELTDRLFDGITNDNSWLSDKQILERSIDTVSKEQYEEWFNSLAELCKEKLIEGWGNPPGDIHTVNEKILLPGILNGNVFIGFQPDRGKTSAESYHNPDNAPPHQYAAFYKWLRYVFKTDAVIHMGTHGSLEWLPGKGVGLSESCFPDAILSSIPNIYPYIINNPGEGMQAKRRSYAAVVTHMIPSMTRADGYEDIEELEAAVQAHMEAESKGLEYKIPLIDEKLAEVIRKMSIQSDLNLEDDFTLEDVRKSADRLYDYILEVKDTLINDGLHILGKVPEGERLIEMIYSLVRNANADVPSLRASLAASKGLDIHSLISSPSSVTAGKLNGILLDEIDLETFNLLRKYAELGFDTEKCVSSVSSELKEVTEFICGFLYPAVLRMEDELASIIHALNGGFISPGPSGCPTRGRAHILPTGRNFYSIDPDGIPWHSSWEIGKKMADEMVDKYVTEKGEYPKSVGIVVWATDTMRTGGDDISYVLWLMGLRPVWTSYGGRVKDLEVVPLSELKRPRIDVTLRISGLFRDAFPNLVEMIDDGVRMIASLDENEEENYLAANLRRDVLEMITEGMPEDQAKKEAGMRIFSTAPGQYGCGVNNLIMNGNWNDINDLGKEYIRYSSYAYGRDVILHCPEAFRKRLGTIDVTIKNHTNRECDLFDCDDDYDFLGGMDAAVTSVRGARPVSVMGDSSDVEHLRTRTLEEECRFVFRSKINNPKWLKGLKEHGFKGAQELSQLFDYMMGWNATSDVIENWMYEDVTENFLLDADTREWIKEENPYALMAMLERLQEAMERGMWDPDDELKEKLLELYLEAEERLEEITDR